MPITRIGSSRDELIRSGNNFSKMEAIANQLAAEVLHINSSISRQAMLAPEENQDLQKLATDSSASLLKSLRNLSVGKPIDSSTDIEGELNKLKEAIGQHPNFKEKFQELNEITEKAKQEGFFEWAAKQPKGAAITH